jgi:hypothetical protein
MAGPKFWNSDLTLIKNFKVKERQNLEFRVAAFNFLNYGLLSFVNNDNNLTLGFDSTGHVTNPDFGTATHHVGNRIMEFAVKYSF